MHGFSGTDGGFLFNNVTYTSSNGPAPQGCDLPIEKQAESPTVTPGGLEGYRLTVRNRGRVSERNLLLCDHIPNHTTFVSANRRLLRLSSRRCLFIPSLEPGHSASVHLMLRVSANTPQGILENIADLTPVPPPGPPAPPPALAEDAPPGGATAPITPIEKVKAAVKVAAKRVHPPPPLVTG